MVKQQQPLPPMPEIGHPESYYARGVHAADKAGDVHTRESLKVGQYITLALDYRLRWAKKLRYFEHALRRHCNPPQLASDEVWMFYRNLAHLVREQCGKEALRLASEEDDRYAERLRMGGTRDRIAADAKPFFLELLGQGEKCPEHFLDEDWEQLKILRNQWVLDYRSMASGAQQA